MKQLIFTAAFSAWMVNASAQQPDANYIPYRKGEAWGYCTADKKILVQPRFEEASMFYGPLAQAKADSHYCIINKKGDILYKNKHYCGTVNNGMHYIASEKYGSEQLFDENGHALTKIYYKIEGFNKYGYARVTAEYTKVGLIDKAYNEVVTPAYGGIEFLSAELLRVYDSKTYKFALMHLPGKQVISAWYDKIYDPREGMLMVANNGKTGFISTAGKEMIPLQYTKEVPVSETRNGRYNESTYEDFNYDGFYEGVAIVVKDDKAGYIDKKGKVAIPFVFEKAFGFSNGRAWVKQNGKWGMIDKTGKVRLPITQQQPNYLYAKELEALDGYHEGLIAIAKDTLWGYADTGGKVVITPRYSRATPFYEGMAAVFEGESMGFIDRQGNYVIPPAYKWAEGVGIWNSSPFRDGCIVALTQDDHWLLINKKGKQLLPYLFGNDVSFTDNIAYAVANDVTYVFDTTGEVLYTFPVGHSVFAHTGRLFYDYKEKCYIDISSKIKYCDD